MIGAIPGMIAIFTIYAAFGPPIGMLVYSVSIAVLDGRGIMDGVVGGLLVGLLGGIVFAYFLGIIPAAVTGIAAAVSFYYRGRVALVDVMLAALGAYFFFTSAEIRVGFPDAVVGPKDLLITYLGATALCWPLVCAVRKSPRRLFL